MAGRLRVADCYAIVQKITARLNTWGTRHISYASKVTLINSVILGIEFWIGNFILPKKVIKKVTTLCRGFLWEKNKIIAWDSVCKPKRGGGCGLKIWKAGIKLY